MGHRTIRRKRKRTEVSIEPKPRKTLEGIEVDESDAEMRDGEVGAQARVGERLFPEIQKVEFRPLLRPQRGDVVG